MVLVALALAFAPADLLVDRAVIWTGGRLTTMTSVAIRDGHFVQVGHVDKSVIGPNTKHLDAKGKVLLPAFIDSHVHFMSGGQSLTRLDLRGANTKQEFLRRIKDWADKLDEHDMVIGSS